MSIQWTKDDHQLVVFARVKPLLALEDPMKLGGHNACQAERTVRPTQDAAHTLASAGVPGSAAYRGEGYRASTAAGEGMLGSSEQQSMDSVVAPYLRLLVLERLVGTNVGCIPGMSLTEQKVEGCCSRRWG